MEEERVEEDAVAGPPPRLANQMEAAVTAFIWINSTCVYKLWNNGDAKLVHKILGMPRDPMATRENLILLDVPQHLERLMIVIMEVQAAASTIPRPGRSCR